MDITNFCSQTTQKTPGELKAEFSDLRSYLYDTLYPEIFKKLQDAFGDEEIKYSDFENFTKNFSSTFDSRFAKESLINSFLKPNY